MTPDHRPDDHDTTTPQDQDDGTTPRGGLSRRGFFGAGAGGLATAVVLGAGVRPADAATGRDLVTRSAGGLVAGDPHAASTLRSGAPRPRRRSRDGVAVRILPIDRATFRPGARFDLRVEASGVNTQSTRIRIVVEGPDGPVPLLVGTPERTSSEPDSIEVTYRDLAYPDPGSHTVRAIVSSRTGRGEATVDHEVLETVAPPRPVKNVIFCLGDGMGAPAVTAARILSKGITEGKYDGLLEMDQMDFRGLVTTSGDDSIATDSANSMSAYMTGHKSSVNALGVYAANDPDPNNHPRVETMAEIVKRSRGMGVGVVTTAEIQDATPAGVWSHVRLRSQYIEIMDQALNEEQMPDVLLGGGRASLLPQQEEGSRREDDRNLIEEFQDRGFAYAGTRSELQQALASDPDKLLGTFTLGNMNVYIDREVSPDPEFLDGFTDQPTLMEMTTAALEVLSRREDGFFLLVEGASIDKMEHPMDGPRATYDTIEFDQAIGIAKRWAQDNGDTLVVVTADHNHSMSIIGTHDARDDANPDRQANRVYGDAGWPTYVDSNGDGFPDDPDPDIQLFFGWASHPDHSDDFEHNEVFRQPALLDADGIAVDNPERDPDAQVQIGNLPYDQTNCVHTVQDVYVMASGAGSDRFNGVLDNTDVFHRMIDALALELPQPDRSNERSTPNEEVADGEPARS